jgi:hypothetical protein
VHILLALPAKSEIPAIAAWILHRESIASVPHRFMLADTAGWNNKQIQPNSIRSPRAGKNLELAKGFEPPTA